MKVEIESIIFIDYAMSHTWFNEAGDAVRGLP